jgi:uncharacterized protein
MMDVVLSKRPQNPTIIQGFPGMGLVGTISTEFLIDHLKAELIGEFVYDELPPTAAIHKGDLVRPMAVYYAEKQNLIILHTILNVGGMEWAIADKIVALAKDLAAKEIICLEGVVSPDAGKEPKVFSFGSEALEKLGAEPLKESIIMGVTGALLLRFKPVIGVFAETHSQLPDSMAAAQIIKALDKYLNLTVDYEPLVEQAKQFEQKIKTLVQKANKATEDKKNLDMNYLG